MWVSLESILKLLPQLQWYIRNNVHSFLDLILHTKNERYHEKQIYKIVLLGAVLTSMLSGCGDSWFERDPKIFLPMSWYGTIRT